MPLRPFILLLATTTLLAGCSGLFEPGPASEEESFSGKLELDVFAARGFLNGSDYERYVLKDDVLWRECGSLVSAKNKQAQTSGIQGDNVFTSDPNLTITQRRVETLTNQDRAKAARQTDLLLQALATAPAPLPPPGGVFGLSQSGVIEASVTLNNRSQRVLTSVDAVSEPESAAATALNSFLATVRSFGPTICRDPTFFGIGK